MTTLNEEAVIQLPHQTNGAIPTTEAKARLGRRLSDREKREMREMRRAGINIDEISKHFGTSVQTVSRHTRRAFANMNGKKTKPEGATIWVRRDDASWLGACATVYGEPINEIHARIMKRVRELGVNKFLA